MEGAWGCEDGVVEMGGCGDGVMDFGILAALMGIGRL